MPTHSHEHNLMLSLQGLCRFTAGSVDANAAGPPSSSPIWTGPTSQPGPPRSTVSAAPSPSADSDVMTDGDIIITHHRNGLLSDDDEGRQVIRALGPDSIHV